MEEYKLNERVLVKGEYLGNIVSINDFREESMRYAIKLDVYKEDVVFVGEKDMQKVIKEEK